jgi:hypothetical protein
MCLAQERSMSTNPMSGVRRPRRAWRSSTNRSTVARLTPEPGRRWQESIRPIAGTDNCHAHHLGVLIAGTLHVVAAHGIESDVGPVRRT